jgi:hypothetical protein
MLFWAQMSFAIHQEENSVERLGKGHEINPAISHQPKRLSRETFS